MNNHADWIEFHRKHRAGTSTVRSPDWLLDGCPICTGKKWELTNDGWAYCIACSKGFSTYGIWTNQALVFFDKNGHHCFMCHGFGYLSGKKCKECFGRVSQPYLTDEDAKHIEGLDHDSVMISSSTEQGEGENHALSIDSKYIARMDVIASDALPVGTMLLVRKGKKRVRGLVKVSKVDAIKLVKVKTDEEAKDGKRENNPE